MVVEKIKSPLAVPFGRTREDACARAERARAVPRPKF
jgi:hypothetical protein